MALILQKLAKYASAEQGSRFRRNIVKVARANIFVQIVSVAAIPVLTRFYAAEDFGLLAVFSSLLGLLASIATLRVEWSMPNANTRQQAVALLILGLAVLSVTVLLVFVLLEYGFAYLSTHWQVLKPLQPYKRLFPVVLLGAGFYQLAHGWYIRNANLSAVSQSKIFQSLTGLSINLVMGKLNAGALGLLLGITLSTWVGVFWLYRHAEGLAKNIKRATFKRLRVAFRRFFSESIYSTIVSLVNSASLAVIPVLLANYYPPREIGWYALMYRIAVTPVGLVTKAVGQSFWAEAAIMVKSDKHKLLLIYLSYSKKLSLLALPVVTAFLFVANFIEPVLGEEEWQGAGYILAALMPLVAGNIIVQPLTHLVVHKKQLWKLFLDAAKLLLIIITISWGASQGLVIQQTVFMISSIIAVSYFILFFMNLTCLRR